mgnify:CR=1 FL=1
MRNYQEPSAKKFLRPEQVKAQLTKAAALTNPGPDGKTPLEKMSHEERVELAQNLEAYRDRLSDPNHPQHTRIVAWAQNRKGWVDRLYTAINVTRARISEIDPAIPPRPKAPIDLASPVNDLFGDE